MSYELYEAIVDGEIETANQLVANGEDIHHVTANDKWSYLHQVADTKQTPSESFQYLIDQGLDVNAIDSYGYTPLIYAVRQQNIEGMRLLLENGADELIEHRASDDATPLNMVFDSKPYQYEIMKLLLDFGADPDTKTEKGKSVRELVNLLDDMDPKIIELVSHY